MSGQDRRKFKRYRTVNLKSNYLFARSGGEVKGEGTAEVENISYGGVKLKLALALIDGPYFLLEVTPENSHKRIAIVGKVVWKNNNNGDSTCGIRLEWCTNEDAYAKYLGSLEQSEEIY